MTFNEWYLSKGEWFHEPVDSLKRAWETCEDAGMDGETIGSVFDGIYGAVAAEYGD